MSEEFVVDEEAIKALKDTLEELTHQTPKDRLEHALYTTNNLVFLQQFAGLSHILVKDLLISHRASEEALKNVYNTSRQLLEGIIWLEINYLNAVPTYATSQARKGKGLKGKLQQWFS